jgi:hypothetical protein
MIIPLLSSIFYLGCILLTQWDCLQHNQNLTYIYFFVFSLVLFITDNILFKHKLFPEYSDYVGWEYVRN